MQPGIEKFLAKARRIGWGSAAGFLIAFSPAIVLAVLIESHAVNIPVWDGWERGPLIEKWKSGALTFHDLYAPHIDHRIFFPRILTLVLNSVSGGDLRWEIAATFLIGLAAGLGVWQLARMTLGRDGAAPWGIVFVVNLILFSPLQWDNWLWAIQTAFMLPMTCLVWALVAVQKPWRWWIRLLAAAALALVGTHSFGHGLFLWPAVFAAVALLRRPGETAKEKAAFLATWTALAAVVIGCYFLIDFKNVSDATHAYGRNPGDDPPAKANFGQFLEAPEKTVHYFLASAGNLYSRVLGADRFELAKSAGGGLILLFAGLGIWALTRCRRRELWNTLAPWLVLGATAIAILAVVAISRVAASHVERSLAPRYTSVSLYLSLAILFLLILLSRSIAWPRWRAVRGKVEIAFLAGLAALQLPVWIYGAHLFDLWKVARLQEQAELRFINFFPPDGIHRIDATAAFAKRSANLLNDRGYLDPPLAESLELSRFKPLDRPRTAAQAGVETFEKLPDGRFRIAGYALLGHGNGRPADAVFLVRDGGKTGVKGEIFAVASAGKAPPAHRYGYDIEFAGRDDADRGDWLRWEKTFAVNGPVSITVYAFDEVKDRAYRIAGRWEVDAGGDLREIEPSPVKKK